MTRFEYVRAVIGEDRLSAGCSAGYAEVFAPSNIALIKYWGKRCRELNLPTVSSLSLSLGKLGTRTRVEPIAGVDKILLSGQVLGSSSEFARRVSQFLDLFRGDGQGFLVETENTVPTGAGLASSASGFAALTLALDQIYGWKVSKEQLSGIARLGSGSAARSLYPGFVEWSRGEREDGLDSVAHCIDARWPELRLALITVSSGEKMISSRAAMERVVSACPWYSVWVRESEREIHQIRSAIASGDFNELGAIAEANALRMHATTLCSYMPHCSDTQCSDTPLCFWLPGTVEAMNRVWRARRDGLAVYFTIDAGPNLVLLFEQRDEELVLREFPEATVVAPFG